VFSCDVEQGCCSGIVWLNTSKLGHAIVILSSESDSAFVVRISWIFLQLLASL